MSTTRNFDFRLRKTVFKSDKTSVQASEVSKLTVSLKPNFLKIRRTTFYPFNLFCFSIIGSKYSIVAAACLVLSFKEQITRG